MEQEEEKEKVLVPVLRHENTREEELDEEPNEEEVRPVPRRWYIY